MKKLGLVKICLFVCFVLYSQQDLTIPDRPIIDLVSVDPFTGHVTITWTMPSPQVSNVGVDEFVLYWFEFHPRIPGNPSSVSRPFADIKDLSGGPVFTYTFDYDTLLLREPMMPDPRLTTVGFEVAAINTGGISDNEYKTSLRAHMHYNTQLTHDYDPCRSEIRLRWHPYSGWRENTAPFQPFKEYRIIQVSQGGTATEEIQTLTWRDTTFLITDINSTGLYRYYIEAVRNDGLVSTSILTEENVEILIPPSFVAALNTRVNDADITEISFIIDPSAQTHSYLLSGASNPNFAFVPIAEYDIFSDTVLVDTQRRSRTYYYRLDAMHVCQGRPHVASSNVATGLWLSIRKNDLKNTLQWDRYLEWNSDAYYEVYRRVGEGLDQLLVTVSHTEETTLIDDLELADMYVEEEVCYWIKAIPTASGSSQEFGISNTVCVKPESRINTPSAFIPGDTNIDNSIFKPEFTFPPEEYMFFIYDRTGALVYETRNHNEGWNGRLLNGSSANEGVYTYFLRFRTAAGRIVERRGTVVLVMPY